LCGRTITDPKSIETGYGPICYKKKFGASATTERERATRMPPDIYCYDIPGQMTIEGYLKTALGQ
jgi:hypothetical protein